VARYLMERRNRRPNTRRAPQQHVSSNYSRRQTRPRPGRRSQPLRPPPHGPAFEVGTCAGGPPR
jgi:hypothetical protein